MEFVTDVAAFQELSRKANERGMRVTLLRVLDTPQGRRIQFFIPKPALLDS